MIQPQQAPVRPRVLSPLTGERLLLEDEIRRHLDAGDGGVIGLVGPPGSGKITALRHLAAVLEGEPRLRFVDGIERPDVRLTAGESLVVFATAEKPSTACLAVYRLAPWNDDDLIEYLLAVHRDRCAGVMARLPAADRGLFEGCPELWQIVLKILAANEFVPSARYALYRHLAAQLPDSDLLERTRSLCLNVLVAPARTDLLRAVKKLAKGGVASEVLRVLRHRPVQLLLGADRIAADLHGEADCDFLANQLPRELVQAAADLLLGDFHALEHLQRLLDGPSWSHAMAASILHRVVRWAPEPGRPLTLAGAYLDGAVWPEVHLGGRDLSEADLSNADLRRADLQGARARETLFQGAQLAQTRLTRIKAVGADLSDADLTGAQAEEADFERADLENATLDDANLKGVSFFEATLTGASARRADLTSAMLMKATLSGADFSGANLRGANLRCLRLGDACFRGACFEEAKLGTCDLEYLDLTGTSFAGADLGGALLTGCLMAGCDLRRANLQETGLADVNWEGADLRGADLTNASFHLGSTRSGMLITPIACEGSRTGFYTDDYEEQCFKAPEEIRKANLCGADLRGAKLDGVDFYLVDLRGARFDAGLEGHFRRCRAIL